MYGQSRVYLGLTIVGQVFLAESSKVSNTKMEYKDFISFLWDNGSIRSIPDEDSVRRIFGISIFGVHSNRNRCVFILNKDPEFYTNSGGPLQYKLIVGLDTPVSELNLGTPADILGEFRVETIFRIIDRIWKALQSLVKSFRTSPISGQNPYFSHLYFNHNILLLRIESFRKISILLDYILY